MPDYLIFQLYGPLASWGDIAVGETRHSSTHPSKSALIGLVAASLGIERRQEDEQKHLASCYRFYVKTIAHGSFLQDFHTIQTAASLKKNRYHSRCDLLLRDEKLVKTILSTREYRCDAFSLIALQGEAGARYTLSEIKKALLQPKYSLYLGRKSCPLSLPLYPNLIRETAGWKQALDRYWRNLQVKLENSTPFLLKSFELLSDRSAYYWEGEDPHITADLIAPRYDQPLSRRRWQFSPRQEHQKMIEKGE